jgi:hypothetical protein
VEPVIMNALKATLGLVVFVFGAMSSAQAWAWHDRGHAHFGVYIGAPGYWYSPYYYPPYYPHYYPPVVIAPSSPPTYIEQEAAQPAPAPAQSDWWYYCADSKAYYPYVKECPAGWQRVAPRPPS